MMGGIALQHPQQSVNKNTSEEETLEPKTKLKIYENSGITCHMTFLNPTLLMYASTSACARLGS
jgi:hypothetical protein